MSNKKILIVILLLIAVTGVAVPITYARYTNTHSGSGKANVAKWDVEVNGKKIDEDLIIDLFSSIENVSTSTTNYIMPGSEGSFDLKVKNKSDVNVIYSIEIEEVINNKDIPIVYSLVENGEYQKAEDFIIADGEELLYGEINNYNEYKIYWKWPFESSGENLVITTDETFKVKVNITVNQELER